MKKSKIGLITTHDTNNYGAILQTFALSYTYYLVGNYFYSYKGMLDKW